MEELAQRSSCGIEELKGFLKGRREPHIAPLQRIAAALGTRLGTILDDLGQAGAVLMRKKDRSDAPLQLAAGKPDRHMEPIIIDMAPGEDAAFCSDGHEGEEFLYVIDGELLLRHGTQEYRLNPGDSIYFDAVLEHRMSSCSQGPTRFLAVRYESERSSL